ncbi:hypothetical protein CVT24_010039 [Panaeolus cyanescens]|uniref:BTB domain-containing protein n=1 Tax=Panaeolus cyanescens TaxID=181874 RepID=A0A409WMB9_9AGAR|nr:hypothetical protein CVT24_010039 [Panaeolus cyanescens]
MSEPTVENPGSPIRSEISIDEDNDSIKRHKNLWFDDGSIVLQAGRTQFRVHKSLLTRTSTVFSDMFLLPQPGLADGEELVEGCHVVHLQDSEADVGYLLESIYDHPDASRPSTSKIAPMRVPKLAALLRLGNKYDVTHLRDNALFRIKAQYVEPCITNSAIPSDYIYFREDDETWATAEKLDLAALVFEEGVFSALPLLLCIVISHITIEEIYDGTEREDGTTAILPPELIRKCVLGKDRLAKARTRMSMNQFPPADKIKKHESLWFDDGSIVLQAGQTQFRVHRSLLMRSSSAFRNILTLDQSEESTDGSTQLVEECRLVHMQESAKSLASLLESIYDYPGEKKAKLVDKEPACGPELQRGDPWFDDGSVVIQAGHTQFRVHKSMLSRCSSVFRDTFSLNQPEDDGSEEMVEDCPVVYLDDSAEDIGCLLCAIYEHPNAGDPREPIHPMPMATLSALLRLGDKYDISHLRDNALFRIQGEFIPASLQDMNSYEYSLILSTNNNREATIPIQVANLAHKAGIFSALPLALRDICEFADLEEIFDEYTEEDGTTVKLAMPLVRSCIIGKAKLEDMVYEAFSWLKEAAFGPKCPQGNVCLRVFRFLTSEIFRPHPPLRFALRTDFEDLVEYGENVGKLCEDCQNKISPRFDEERQKMWEKMPVSSNTSEKRRVIEGQPTPEATYRLARVDTDVASVCADSTSPPSFQLLPLASPQEQRQQQPLDAQEHPQRIKKHPSLWFNNGSINIVLQAGRTQFRVHKSLVLRQSPVLGKMFPDPMPFEDAFDPRYAQIPAVEGCRILHLQESAEDWEYVLLAIYHPPNVVFAQPDPTDQPMPFSKLSAFLRLGRKYGISSLYNHALHLIKLEYIPTDPRCSLVPKLIEPQGGWKKDHTDMEFFLNVVTLLWREGVHATESVSIHLMSTSDRPNSTPTSNDTNLVPESVVEQPMEIEQGSVWMEDGNVILQAENTQFRVHKSILSRASSVFRDMFSLPRSPTAIPETTALAEGCPVVHLHDTAEDLSFL